MRRQSVLVTLMMFLGPFLLGNLLSTPSALAQVEYISPAQSQQLREQFVHARPLTELDLQVLRQKALTCTMFGIRSRMSVEKDVALYQLRPAEESRWINRGSQIVSDYHWSPSWGLVGQQSQGKDRLKDELRRLENGQWISRLSWQKPSDSLTLAYSLCVEAKAIL